MPTNKETLSKETFCIEISGDYACFTRPEMKVERVSYDVITPSAARAVFEAILWKPAFRWQVCQIDVLKPIRWTNIRRNEVAGKASERRQPILIEDDRQQRGGLFLRDIAYRLYARFELQDDQHHIHHYPHLQCSDSDKSENTYSKFAEMFKRRACKGQCFNQPYLGTREFAADFRWIEPQDTQPDAIEESRDLGWMLYDLDFSDPKMPAPRFFHAKLEQGTIHIPDWHSQEVYQ